MTYGVIRADEKNAYERLNTVRNKLKEIIIAYKIKHVLFEEVPISDKANLSVGKILCVLQGVLLSLCFEFELTFKAISPTEWRSKVGLLRTEYSCKECGNKFEDVSGIEVICEKCGNAKNKLFSRNPLNTRDLLKQRAVNLANDYYNLELYFKGSSKKNEDDIAESLCIWLSDKEEEADE
ncbi:MAG: hypothetical protein WCO84_01500 [bacterium]